MPWRYTSCTSAEGIQLEDPLTRGHLDALFCDLQQSTKAEKMADNVVST